MRNKKMKLQMTEDETNDIEKNQNQGISGEDNHDILSSNSRNYLDNIDL